jgi:hypothetical protein
VAGHAREPWLLEAEHQRWLQLLAAAGVVVAGELELRLLNGRAGAHARGQLKRRRGLGMRHGSDAREQ